MISRGPTQVILLVYAVTPKVRKKPLIQTCDSGLQRGILKKNLHLESLESTGYLWRLDILRFWAPEGVFTVIDCSDILTSSQYLGLDLVSAAAKSSSNFVDKSKISLMIHSQNHTLRRGSGSSLGDLLRVCWFICKDGQFISVITYQEELQFVPQKR